MSQVLVHHRSAGCFFLLSHICALLFAISSLLPVCAGQTTQGIGVVQSPKSQSVLLAGTPLPITVDVSAQTAPPNGSQLLNVVPNTNQITSLNVFLVSTAEDVNITLSSGPGLLAGDPGNPLKHFDFTLPDCLSPGNYDVDFYEFGTMSGKAYSTVTSVPIHVQNPNPQSNTTSCGNMATTSTPSGFSSAAVEGSAPASQHPATVTVTVSTSISLPTGTGVITITLDPSGYPVSSETPVTVTLTGTGGTETSTSSSPSSSSISNGSNTTSESSSITETPATVTATETVTTADLEPTTVTVIMVSQSISTITAAPSGFSTTYTSLGATTTTMTAIVGHNGFLPVNEGIRPSVSHPWLALGICASSMMSIALFL